jgi:plastocyanin
MRWLLAIVATLALAPAAYAQGATVQGIDDPPSSGHWEPKDLTGVKVGDTVTWTWTGFHNVKSTSGPWDVTSSTTSPFTYTFTTPGTYAYLCQFHQGMDGTVTVSDASGTPPPPPPPPPLSEQPLANDQQPPSAFEIAESVRPRLSRLRVAPVENGARLRFRLSERARVTVRFKLASVIVKSARRTFEAGSRSLVVRGRRLDGRYQVEVFARDLAGNRSATKHASVRVR